VHDYSIFSTLGHFKYGVKSPRMTRVSENPLIFAHAPERERERGFFETGERERVLKKCSLVMLENSLNCQISDGVLVVE
jgi:hypothetical protein